MVKFLLAAVWGNSISLFSFTILRAQYETLHPMATKREAFALFPLKDFKTLHDPKIGIPTVTRARRASSMEIGETNRARQTHTLTSKAMTLSE